MTLDWNDPASKYGYNLTKYNYEQNSVLKQMFVNVQRYRTDTYLQRDGHSFGQSHSYTKGDQAYYNINKSYKNHMH